MPFTSREVPVVSRPAGRSVFVMLLLAVAPVALRAQSGTIQGKVADSAGTAIVGAIVSVDHTVLRTTTGSGGRYEIRGVPTGTRTVRARAIGFQAAEAEVTVAPNGTVDHNFNLTRSPVMLAP